MDREAVETKVIAIVSEQMGVDEAALTRETAFANDLGADSLETIELVMKFEDEFDIDILDKEAEGIQTVGAAIDYVVNATRAKSREPSDPPGVASER